MRTPARMYLNEPEEVERQLLPLMHDEPLGLDIETTGLDPLDPEQRLLLVQVSDGEVTLVLDTEALRDRALPLLRQTIRMGGRLIVGDNLDFEYRWLKARLGITLERVFDTMVAEQIILMGLLPPGKRPSLEELALKYEGVKLDKSIREGFIDRPEGVPYTLAEIDYAALDAEVVLPIMRQQTARMKREGLVPGAKLRMQMLPVVGDMELHGAPIDVVDWKAEADKLDQEWEERSQGLLEELTPPIVVVRARRFEQENEVHQAWRAEYDAAKLDHELAVVVRGTNALAEAADPDGVFTFYMDTPKERRAKINALNRAWKEDHPEPKKPVLPLGPINLASDDQLKDAYQELGVRLDSTQREALEQVNHPTIQPLLAWKKTHKLRSTYGNPLLAKQRNGRLHGSFNLVVRTGRMSSSQPNMQNIPPQFRQHFLAPDGYDFVIADFSQIELRILADMSGDPTMLAAYEARRDLHTETVARSILRMPYEEVLALATTDPKRAHEARLNAKRANFGVIYGLSDPEMIAIFSTSFPVAWEWIKQQGEAGWNRGWTASASGLRRYYDTVFPPDLNGRERWSFRASIERQAMNHPIQGTSADITEYAAVQVRERMRGLLALWNIVHDELDGESPSDQAQHAATCLRAICLEAGSHFLKRVPIEVEVLVSKRWSK